MLDKESRIKKINETEKILKASEDLRNEAITKKKMYEEQLEGKKKELLELGTTPEEAEKKIAQLTKEIDEDLEFINASLPVNLLKKWGKI